MMYSFGYGKGSAHIVSTQLQEVVVIPAGDRVLEIGFLEDVENLITDLERLKVKLIIKEESDYGS